MQRGNKTSIISVVLTAALAFVLWSVLPARASTVPELVAQIGAVSGLTATSSGSEITVTGNATATSTLILDIDPGVTINWEANYSGALSARYVLVLQGAGTFNLTGSVSNSSYGAINVTGAGGTKLDINGGTLLSAGGGYTLSIAADNVIANINGGMVSRSGGTNSAINVGSGLNDVKINIDGGTVSSISGGNAINDSGSNTKITISGGGTVIAGSASAIRSTGAAAEVIVLNSVVTNVGTVAANATIYVTAVSNNQVTISGMSIVENTYVPVSSAQAAYAIQTGGNVTVADDAKVMAYSRAINLVGTNSIATISGGKVVATGTGANSYAISTATTDPGSVVNAKVLVTGGWVSATAGNAIHVTGANSVVTVSGGWVTAETGHAINATNSTATVTVNGGFVFAYGTTRDDVVHATSPIFLYTSPDNAVVLTWDRQTAASLVPTGELILYAQQTRNDLTTWIGISAGTMWQNHPNLGAGIFYTNGVNTGFFPISGVEVYVDHGLIFQYDTTEYKIFRDINGNGARDVQDLQFSYAGPLIPPKFEINTNTLYLNDFRWSTNRQYALTVHDNATISLGGSNMLTSIDNYTSDPSVISPQSYGLNIDPGVVVTIGGYGSLEMSGNTSAIKVDNPSTQLILPAAYIYWVNDEPSNPGGAGIVVLPGDSGYQYNTSDKYLKISTLPFATVDSVTISGSVGASLVLQTATLKLYSGARWDATIGTDISSWFKNLPTGVEVFISGHPGDVDGDGIVTMDDVTIVMQASGGLIVLSAEQTVVADMDGDGSITVADAMAIARIASGIITGDTIIVTFTGTPWIRSEDAFDIVVPMTALAFPVDMHASTYTDIAVQPNPNAKFDITASYTLIVTAEEGGNVTVISPLPAMSSDGSHFEQLAVGTLVNVTATAWPGYHFVGWTLIGSNAAINTNPSATFYMPSNTVTLMANFVRNLSGPVIPGAPNTGYY